MKSETTDRQFTQIGEIEIDKLHHFSGLSIRVHLWLVFFLCVLCGQSPCLHKWKLGERL